MKKTHIFLAVIVLNILILGIYSGCGKKTPPPPGVDKVKFAGYDESAKGIKEFIEKRDLDKARYFADEAIRKYPDKPELLYLRVEANVTKADLHRNLIDPSQKKTLEEVKKDLDEAIKRGGGEKAYLMRANYYDFVRDFKSALADAEMAAKLSPNSSAAQCMIGHVYYSNTENMNEAMKYINKAIELDPKNVLAYDLKGLIYCMKLNKGDKGLGYFEKALSIDPEDPCAILNVAIEKEKNYGDDDYNLKTIEKLKKVEELYEKRLKGESFYLANSIIDPVTLNYSLFSAYFEMMELQEALKYLDKAIGEIKFDTQKTLYMAYKAELLCRMGKYQEANKLFNRTILPIKEADIGKNHINLEDYLTITGNANAARGQYIDALANFEKAMKLFPGQPEYGFMAATQAYKLAKIKEARTLCGGFDAKVTDRIRQTGGNLNNPLISELIGTCRVINGKYGEAIEPLSISIKSQPENMDLRFFRGSAYFHLKKYPEASVDFKKILDSEMNAYMKKSVTGYMGIIRQ